LNKTLMIIKNPEELEILRRGGRILATVLDLVAKKAVPGVSAEELDKLAEKEILTRGGFPSFKGYSSQAGDPAFPAALCVSVNDEVVHGIPTKDKILKEGDIVGLDLGVKYKGLFTDMATTVAVGKVGELQNKLIQASKECLAQAIKQARLGNFTGDIGFATESTAKKYGFEVVRELVGHGVGKAVHEEPEVPGFGKPGKGSKLVEGLVIAIEPMVNAGDWKIAFAEDNWTIKTADNSLSAHAEHTVLVTSKGCEILTSMV